MKFISREILDRKVEMGEDILIVDVRESYEYEEENIGGINIPLDEVLSRFEELPRDKEVIFCCRSGSRSSAMTHTLERKYGLQNLYTLEGGLAVYFDV